MVNFAKHSCGDSRLSCSECQTTVCPKCMVECPVGNRCRKCAAKTESHVLKVSPVVGAKTFVVSALCGCAFSFVSPFTGAWFYSWIIVYFVGTLVGNLIHRISGYKLGPAIVSIVISGIAIGAFLSPASILRDSAGSQFDQYASMEVMQSETEELAQMESQMKSKDSTGIKLDAASIAKIKEQEALVKQHNEQIRKEVRKSLQFWQVVNLLVFAFGVLTPFTGIVPPFPIFPFRR